jgi:hypothetical protein
MSNSTIERALLSDATHTLSWGPTLFRVLLAGHGVVLLLIARLRGKHILAAEQAGAPEPNTTESVSHRTSWQAWGALALLTIIALGLRLWHLNSGLWFDEVLTLLDFVRPPLGEILVSFPSQNQHMLYSILAHASTQVFGESAWALRLPSVIFGVGSLWALFFLGRRVVGTREALFACVLMAVSYHHIWFSQNARGYMGLLFFATLATWLWLEGLSRSTWPWWLAYVVAVSLGMWTHLTMAFVVAAHALVYLALLLRHLWDPDTRGLRILQPGLRWQPVLVWVVCVSVVLQLYALALPAFLRTALHEVSLPSEWTNPLWIVIESLRSLQIGFSSVVVVLCGAGCVGIGWLSLLRQNWSAGVLLVLPALLAGSTMLILGHNLWPRFFFFSMGFVLLIVVHGAMTVPRLLCTRLLVLRSPERVELVVGVVLTSLLMVASAATVPRVYALPKQDFAGARDYVEQQRTPDDVVVAVGLAGIAYGRYYAPHWSVAQTLEELDAVRQARTTTWLVYTLPIEVKAYRAGIWERIEQDFEIVKVFPGTLGGGQVYVCRQRAAAQTSTFDSRHVLHVATFGVAQDVAWYWS